MSDKKLTELTPADSAALPDLLYGVQGGTSKRFTIAQVLAALNALSTDLDAGDNVISNFRFKGGVDTVYDLSVDPDGLIDGGKLSLTEDENFYVHPALGSALTIEFPTPEVGTAPFGMLTFALAPGGSVTLPSSGWLWEKASASEADPVLPTAANSIFRLRYSYDPVTAKYAVAYSQLPTSTASVGAVAYVEGSFQYSTVVNNADTKTLNYNFVSDTQDGTTYLIVGCILDGPDNIGTVPAFLTPITNPPTGNLSTQPQGHWYYYKPSQGELDTGTLTLTFTKTNESGHIIAFEVTGANATDPVGGTAYDRSSSQTRTSISPVELNPVVDGCLLVSALGCDIGPGDKPDISTAVANGFTELGKYNATLDGTPSFIVNILAVSEAGDYDSPIYEREVDGNARTQLEAFWLVP